MRSAIRIGVVGLVCLSASVVAVLALSDPEFGANVQSLVDQIPGVAPEDGVPSAMVRTEPVTQAEPSFPLFSTTSFETAGYGLVVNFTGEIADRSSIEQVRQAYRTRALRGMAEKRKELRSVTTNDPGRGPIRFQTKSAIALLLLHQGDFEDAAAWVTEAVNDSEGLPQGLRDNLEALIGVIQLRRGETENCLECRGPSACIFPIAPDAVHLKPSGSREAVRNFTAYLAKRPEDMGVRWLLNIAQMTLGGYPDKVPAEFRIPLAPFASRIDVGRFENVASKVGLTVRGPNMAGGSIFDDFNGDGRPDVFTTSFDPDLGASLMINRGDGTFEDRSEAAGLGAQPLAVNCTQADYDNDGRLDVLLLRGGWENAIRMTLLRNTGDGTFADVTEASGLGEPIASHSAAWGDFDNDGFVDLFVCGEYASSRGDGLLATSNSLKLSQPENRCRLYKNRGDGTFVNMAESAGVLNHRVAKGATWGDYDGDGLLDLYVSNYDSENRLYHNKGNGTFEDLAPALGVTHPLASFSCWFWDYDNDGRLDIFVNDYRGELQDYVESVLGRPSSTESHPRLFRNLGPDGFRDVSTEVGLDRIVLAMGASFGDIDNDGYLDVYLATGRPGLSGLMPNVLYKNVGGRRFEDVSTSSGTGHLQKGHGVSFADWDDDGDLDLFVETGGAVPGDRAFNLLFQNPGHGKHWLKVKLVGTRTNRSALGAILRADLSGPGSATSTVYRHLGSRSSYGGNSLVELIGFGEATALTSLTVTWPVSGTRQVFRNIGADQDIEITEGVDTYRVLTRSPVPSSPGS